MSNYGSHERHVTEQGALLPLSQGALPPDIAQTVSFVYDIAPLMTPEGRYDLTTFDGIGRASAYYLEGFAIIQKRYMDARNNVAAARQEPSTSVVKMGRLLLEEAEAGEWAAESENYVRSISSARWMPEGGWRSVDNKYYEAEQKQAILRQTELNQMRRALYFLARTAITTGRVPSNTQGLVSEREVNELMNRDDPDGRIARAMVEVGHIAVDELERRPDTMSDPETYAMLYNLNDVTRILKTGLRDGANSMVAPYPGTPYSVTL